MSSSSQEVEVAVILRFGIDVKSILANLVGVLARRWNLDTATPIEVEVAELVGKVLQNCTIDIRSVIAHEEVSWQNASLSGRLTN